MASVLGRAEQKDFKLSALRDVAESALPTPIDPPLHPFAENENPLQFRNYFYPWEWIYLRTNNFEKFAGRVRKTNKFFHNDQMLQNYTRDMTDTSSNNEDRPPASEELFFDTDLPNLYDQTMLNTRYAPKLTKMQKSFLRDLNDYIILPTDDQRTIGHKHSKRMDLIRGYCKDLKRKRYAKAFRRFTEVRARRLELVAEATELMEREIRDKCLTRNDYYDENEPSEFKTLLLESRRNAIAQKYQQYIIDAQYRRSYRNRIYYNVYKDVPETDTLHMDGNVLAPSPAGGNLPSGTRSQPHTSAIPSADRTTTSGSHMPRVTITPPTPPRSPISQPSAGLELDDMQTSILQADAIDADQNCLADMPTSDAEFMSDFEPTTTRSRFSDLQKKQRLLQSYIRYRQVAARSLDPKSEAAILAMLELKAKHLFDIKPHATMCAKRSRAIKRKFTQYAADASFRRSYIARMESFRSNSAAEHRSDQQMNVKNDSSQNLSENSRRMRGGGPKSNPTTKSIAWAYKKKIVNNKTFELPDGGGSVNVMYCTDGRNDEVRYAHNERGLTPKRMHEPSSSGILKKMQQNMHFQSPEGQGLVTITYDETEMASPQSPASMDASSAPIGRPRPAGQATPYPRFNAGDESHNDSDLYSPAPSHMGIRSENSAASYTAHSLNVLDQSNPSIMSGPPLSLSYQTTGQQSPSFLTPNYRLPAMQTTFSPRSQPDSDIPTSEIELMSDFESTWAPRHARRRERHTKALNRLTTVSSMHLTPQEESQRLLTMEIADKGLNNPSGPKRDIYVKRVRAIERKLKKYAENDQFRQHYRNRINSNVSSSPSLSTTANLPFHSTPTHRTFDQPQTFNSTDATDSSYSNIDRASFAPGTFVQANDGTYELGTSQRSGAVAAGGTFNLGTTQPSGGSAGETFDLGQKTAAADATYEFVSMSQRSVTDNVTFELGSYAAPNQTLNLEGTYEINKDGTYDVNAEEPAAQTRRNRLREMGLEDKDFQNQVAEQRELNTGSSEELSITSDSDNPGKDKTYDEKNIYHPEFWRTLEPKSTRRVIQQNATTIVNNFRYNFDDPDEPPEKAPYWMYNDRPTPTSSPRHET